MRETVWIGANALASLEAEARAFRFRETGGPLFGYEGVDGTLVITRALGPGRRAVHRRFRFVADPRDTQEAIDATREQTGGRDRYVGQWHTHPLGPAQPSSGDVETLSAIAEQEDVQLPEPLALIQQTKPLRRRTGMGELAAFQLCSDGRIVRKQVTVSQEP